MYDRRPVRRRRAALAVSVLASVGLLTIFFGEPVGGGLHAIQRGAQVALAPLQKGASLAFEPVRDVTGWVGAVLGAQEENERLRAELVRLRGEAAGAATDRRDVDQLRALVRLGRRDGFPQGVEPVTARVIARSPTVWYSAVTIDKGADDAIETDQPVVTGDGLAGKVTAVTDGTARVTLITDESSAVSAAVVPDGAGGIVKPELANPRDLLVDFLEKGRPVRRGATVVTSGTTSGELESLFPRGIPIGRVKKVDEEELELYQRVHIEPFADLRRMDFVQVLTSAPGGQRAEALAR